MKRFAAAVLALILGSPALAAESSPHVQRVDVNTATEEQLRTTLGVDAEQARRIVEARPYHRKDELKTRNVLSGDEFDKLQRLIESVC